MALQSGLFKSQDQQEQDLTDGPGWTIDEQKPTFFGNFAGAIPRGLGQGAADGINVLAHGISTDALPALIKASPFASLISGTGPDADVTKVPGVKEAQEKLDAAADATREYSKSLMPDPRITGVGSNVIQGFSKAATEFTAGTLAAGPAAGAALLGSAEGYAHYQDLLDQGVDPETAQKSAMLTGTTSAISAVMPMALPARLLSSLSTAGTLLAQAGTGSLINTGFGVATRYESAKILADAGYQSMADQTKPWDETNLLTDALTGLFFGAHAGYHGLKDLRAADIDPSIRDAAKVVQDRQEVIDRAPGVPVDMASAAIHRQSLETALGDLLSNKRVNLGDETDGATFARGDVDDSAALQIMHDEFMRSGVLDDAAAFDRWARGETEVLEPRKITEKPTALERPEEPAEPQPPKAEEAEPGELGSKDIATQAVTDRPDLQIVDEHGEAKSAADEQARAAEAESRSNKEAEPMFEAAVRCEARHA